MDKDPNIKSRERQEGKVLRSSFVSYSQASRKRHGSENPLSFDYLIKKWIKSHQISFLNGVRHLIEKPVSSLLTCLVIALVLSVFAFLGLVLDNFDRLEVSWRYSEKIALYLQLDTTKSQATKIINKIKKLEDVVSVEFINRTEAFNSLKDQMNLGETLNDLPKNPLPHTILVTPNDRRIDESSIIKLYSQLSHLPKVEEVYLDLERAKRLEAIISLISRFADTLKIILIISLILIVGNSIGLHIQEIKEEIEIGKLLGATDSYVRRPFLYMGVLYGLGGGLVACVIITLSIQWIANPLYILVKIYGSRFISADISYTTQGSLSFSAMLLGYIGAWISIGRELLRLSPR